MAAHYMKKYILAVLGQGSSYESFKTLTRKLISDCCLSDSDQCRVYPVKGNAIDIIHPVSQTNDIILWISHSYLVIKFKNPLVCCCWHGSI